ncbi:MAG: hypothetical protein PHD74_07290 [Candidatus Krumholzibacteria bacterium]|nr:hypothetical protein [Candidatus Krumholzibacteria bacterium]
MKRMLIMAALLALAAGAFAQEKPHALRPDQVRMPASAGAIIQEPVFTDLPGYGKKCHIGDAWYFTYKFNKNPKLGTAILKIQLFDNKGIRVTDFDVIGMSEMPSMRGAHDSGEVHFKLNKRGDYLLPVNVVMPGEWEVKLVFLKDKAPVFRGRFMFKV